MSQTTDTGNEFHQLQALEPSSGCSGIIERVTDQTSAKHANAIKTIVNTMQKQHQQIHKFTV